MKYKSDLSLRDIEDELNEYAKKYTKFYKQEIDYLCSFLADPGLSPDKAERLIQMQVAKGEGLEANLDYVCSLLGESND